MERKDYTEIIFSVLMVVFGLVTLLIWIPNDIDTGMVETFRRQTVIGDSFLPVVSAAAILFCSTLLLIGAVRKRNQTTAVEQSLTIEDFKFQLIVMSIVAVSLCTMFWLGPISTMFSEAGYRDLRSTFPYKYIGFFFGGVLMMGGLITLIEGKLDPRRLGISVIATLLLIFIFDVPFDSLLLPPNGDW